MAEENKNKKSLDKVLYKVGQCIDFQSLYALEEDLNRIGLSIQGTSSNRMILCKLREGKVVAENVVDDYIFVGSLATSTQELTDRTVEKICDFIRNNAGQSSKVENIARVWRNGIRMYESSVPIVNEDVNHIADNLLSE